MIADIMQSGVVYAVLGAFAGLMAGVLGIGGGIIIVPALAYVYSHQAGFPPDKILHLAAGTSLAIMVITSQFSVRAHHHRKKIAWDVYKKLWPGIVIGAVAGAFLADQLHSRVINIIFALFILLICAKTFFDRQKIRPHKYPPAWIHHFVTFIVGLKSGLLGLGGGVLIIPYLTFCGVEVRSIAAISALCTMTIAIVGSIAYMITGFNEPALPPFTTGYVYWPAVIAVAVPSGFFAPIGVSLTYRLPVYHLKMAFIIFLLMVAIDMLV